MARNPRNVTLDNPVFRFNGGRSDGALMAKMRRHKSWSDMDLFCSKHFDKVYAKGYREGWEAEQAPVKFT